MHKDFKKNRHKLKVDLSIFKTKSEFLLSDVAVFKKILFLKSTWTIPTAPISHVPTTKGPIRALTSG